jgi:LuxR family transcriptional regulator, maltose regulon positive regulatory protein
MHWLNSGPSQTAVAGRKPDESTAATRPLPMVRRLRAENRPIEICCLGRFSIQRQTDSAPVFLQVSSRPLVLLQLLVAAGKEGCERSEAEIKLWPRAQVGLSESALDTTLYRLRGLIGNQHAVSVKKGIIRLNDRYVGVDAWRFSSEIETFCAHLQMPASAAESGVVNERCNQLFDLYQGSFFVQDLATPWVVQMRDVLQSKFLRSIKLAGHYWQSVRNWNRAIQLYERALEIDNLAEELHRELMRCHLAQREFADVVHVFRRCRELLSVVMSVAPSDATEIIYRQALAGQVRL